MFNPFTIPQVGNAVPPPMAKEIGGEIKKSLLWKLEQEEKAEIAGKTEKSGEKAEVKEEKAEKKEDKSEKEVEKKEEEVKEEQMDED